MSTLRLSDSDSPRYKVLRGRGVRHECQRMSLPGHWSNINRGMLVRSAHVPDLLALSDHFGVRVIDDRGVI